jgi:hypothetical protein
MPVVLVVRPGVAHPEEQIAVDEADETAHRLGAGDLGVPCVVAYEGSARAEDGERWREEQAHPGVTEQDDARDDAGQGECVDGDDTRVPAVPAFQKVLALDRTEKRRELALAGRRAGPVPWTDDERGCGLGHVGTPASLRNTC